MSSQIPTGVWTNRMTTLSQLGQRNIDGDPADLGIVERVQCPLCQADLPPLQTRCTTSSP